MKLWEKNYLITYILFLIVLNTGMSLLATTTFTNDFQQDAQAAISEKDNISYSISNLYSLKNAESILASLAVHYLKAGVHLKVIAEDVSIIDSLPDDIPSSDILSMKVVEIQKVKHFLITDQWIEDDKTFRLIYLKDIRHIYQLQAQRILTFIFASLILSAIIGIMLYLTMKKIYKPIGNIAHELRTPLTSIRGYSQYMMASKLTEEERFFANEQLIKESQNLQDIVDKLLIMGNLHKGIIAKDKINMVTLFQTIQSAYPQIQIENHLDYFYADPTLLHCLLNNLISNAVRAGDKVTVIAKNRTICIQNNGEILSATMLKSLNKNIALSKDQIHGNGYGVNLCHDIVKLHKGRLKYSTMKEMGTMVTIEFPKCLTGDFYQ